MARSRTHAVLVTRTAVQGARPDKLRELEQILELEQDDEPRARTIVLLAELGAGRATWWPRGRAMRRRAGKMSAAVPRLQ